MRRPSGRELALPMVQGPLTGEVWSRPRGQAPGTGTIVRVTPGPADITLSRLRSRVTMSSSVGTTPGRGASDSGQTLRR